MRLRLWGILPAILLAGCALFVRPTQEELAPSPETNPELHFVQVSPIESSKLPQQGLSPYWDKVRTGGPLKIGINERYPPFGVPVDPAKSQEDAFAGFDVDLAEHLGKTLGVEIELVGISSVEAMDRLNDGSIDLALAGLTRTVYRAGQVNFSQPYLTVSQAAIVERRLVDGSRGTDEERRRNTLESYADLDSIPGLKIAAVKFTRPHRLAVNTFPRAEIKTYDTARQASQALIDNEVNALVHDAPYVRVWPLFNAADAGRFRQLLEPVTEEAICIAIRKGDMEFLRFLDAYVAEVQADGTVARIVQRQFLDAEWLKVAALEEAAQ